MRERARYGIELLAFLGIVLLLWTLGVKVLRINALILPDPLNVLGAGDAFASGFLYGYLQGWPLERAVYLAPVIVVGFAAAAGLLILWGKVALQGLRETKRPRLVLALWVAGIALLVVLSVLGVELPREG